MNTAPTTVPTKYADVRQRILDGGTPLNDRAELLDSLYGIAFVEGRIAGCEEMRDRMMSAFATPLMEQSIANLQAKKAVTP